MTGRRHRDGGPAERTSDQRLASLHLRTGSLSLARAELETMAGDGDLDDEALIDLAEVRWRTGDLPGAGEAADAYLDAGHETTIGLVIAAEALAALGRPSEARRLAERAIARSDRALDGIFAGLPRSSIWPREAGAELVAQPEALGSAGSPTARRGGGLGAGGSDRWTSQRAGDGAPTGLPSSTDAGADGHPRAASGTATLPDGTRALHAAEAALAADDPATAAIQLALALRVAPGLAPAVLDLARDREGAAFDLIRGDAFRLVGREAEARRSFAAAAVGRPEGEEPAASGSATSGPIEPHPAASPDDREGS
jgi:tetratricopeptide (TPR) repeat protein